MKLTLNVPMINRAFGAYTPAGIKDRLQEADRMMQRYGDSIDQACRLNNVPLPILLSILMIENPMADAKIVNYIQATGLGQVRPLTGMDMIYLCNSKKLLTPEKKDVLRKQLGSRLDGLIKADGSAAGFQKLISQSAMIKCLQDAEFNTMVAGLITSMLIAENSPGGLMRADLVAVLYNQGYYALKAAKIAKSTSTEQLLSGRVKPEGKSYILKMVGKHGWLEILSNYGS